MSHGSDKSTKSAVAGSRLAGVPGLDRFLAVADVAPVGLFYGDALGDTLFVNAAAAEIAGIVPGRMTQGSWIALLHPQDSTRVVAAWEAFLAERAPFRCEYRFRRPDGTERWVLAAARHQRDAQGRVVGHVGSVTDITQRKRGEDALRHIVAGVAASVGTGFFRGLVRHLAPTLGAEIALVGRLSADGRSVETLAICDGARILPDVSYALDRSPCAEVLAGRTVTVTHGIRSRFAGHDLLMDLDAESYVGTPLLDASGRALGVLAVMDRRPMPDVGFAVSMLSVFAARAAAELERLHNQRQLERDQQSLEVRVEERTRELLAANAELESFSQSVAHDLRGPLRAIDGFAQTLLEDFAEGLGEQGRDTLVRVRAASQKMGRLLDDLLRLARATQGGVKREHFDLSRMARAVADELRDGARGRRIDVAIEPCPPVHADPVLVRDALQNLFANAFKFTRPRRRASVEFGSCQIETGEPAYYVRDNGVGFEMAWADRLFMPFERLHDELDFEGTGIGLATVERIVRRHGGRVWAESRPGDGATFYFTLQGLSHAHPHAGVLTPKQVGL